MLFPRLQQFGEYVSTAAHGNILLILSGDRLNTSPTALRSIWSVVWACFISEDTSAYRPRATCH